MKKWNESNKNVFFKMWKYYNFGYYFYGSAIVVVLLYVVSTSSLIVRCAALYEFLICLSVAASSIERRARSVQSVYSNFNTTERSSFLTHLKVFSKYNIKVVADLQSSIQMFRFYLWIMFHLEWQDRVDCPGRRNWYWFRTVGPPWKTGDYGGSWYQR